MSMLLREKLQEIKNVAEQLEDATDDLSALIYELEEALDGSDIEDTAKELVNKFKNKYDPVLGKGAEMMDDVDDLLKVLPEEEDYDDYDDYDEDDDY